MFNIAAISGERDQCSHANEQGDLSFRCMQMCMQRKLRSSCICIIMLYKGPFLKPRLLTPMFL